MEAAHIKYMQEALVRDMIVRYCEDYGTTIPEAMEVIYNSETFQGLEDPRTELYCQSPVYLYDCLEHELKYGKIW